MERYSEFGWGGDANPGSQPQYEEDHPESQSIPHDEPDYEPGSAEYNFFFGNGQLHVAPSSDFSLDELRGHAVVAADDIGPMALGCVSVDHGRATWEVAGNVSLRGLHKVLKDYTSQVGWRWHGLTDLDGEPVHDDFAPKKSMALRDHESGKHLRFIVQGRTAYADGLDNEQKIAIIEAGYRLAEVPGGGTMTDRMRWNDPGGETLETFDRGSMGGPTDLSKLRDHRQPTGTFKCPECGQIFPNWTRYLDHRSTEEPMGDTLPEEDGKFPKLDLDKTLPAHYHERRPIIMPLASTKEAARLQEWKDVAEFEGLYRSGVTHWGAFQGGFLTGVISLTEGKSRVPKLSFIGGSTSATRAILSRLQSIYDEIESSPSAFDSRSASRARFVRTANGYRWAAGKDPKDIIGSPVPFIYDVQGDHVTIGQPGQRHSDIPGKFTPGGIVEGTYEPGGKVVIRSMTTIPYSHRHLLDLWYWEYPHMEITGLELEDNAGNVTKLAGVERTSAEIGAYIKTIAATDPAVWKAFQALHAEGGHVYAVGGAVRDALLQKEPKDIDLMVTGLPSEVVEHTLRKLPGQVKLTGKSFGVYRYKEKGHEVEIALPRTETSTGDRRVDFDVHVDHNLPVESDLLRRDFTVNSMAVDLSSGKLVDPYNGADDLKQRRLRTTHPSSFVEDPTRIMRALVMNGRYGMHPDESTRKEMTQHADRLPLEAWDNKVDILEKIMKSDNPSSAFRLAHETGVLKHIFPELETHFDFDQNNPHHRYSLGEHSLNVLENIASKSGDPDLRVAALLHDLGKPTSQWTDPNTGHSHFYKGPNGEGNDHDLVGAELAKHRLEAVHWPKARTKRITHLIEHHMYPAFSTAKGARKFLHRVGDDHADDLLTFRWADQRGKGQTPEEVAARTSVDHQRGLVEQVRTAKEPTAQHALAINGNDIVGLGIKPGPLVGQVLRHLTDDIIEDPVLNERNALLERAQEYASALPS